MKILAFALFALIPTATAFAATESCAVNVAQDPVVLRLGKDEFRIAFGLSGEACKQTACSGTITYRADWKTEDGTTSRQEQKQLIYTVPAGAQHSLVVDRNYFDTSEGKHTTEVTRITVDNVSCEPARETASR